MSGPENEVDVTGPSDDPLEAVYRAHATRLRRYASRLTRDDEAGADVVQDAFVRVRAARGTPTDLDDLRFYVVRTIVNLTHNRARRAEVAERALPWLRSDGPATLPAEREDELAASVARLPLRQREVVYLRYWLDLDVARTAEALGISTGSVKTHTSRALAQLRGLLDGTEMDHDR